EVNDVSTVAARVAVGELHHGGEHALAGMLRDHSPAAVELAGDGERNQHGERDRHQRIEVRNIFPGLEAEGRSPTLRREHEEDGNRDRADRRPHEIALQAFERGLAPGEQRTDGRQYKKEQSHRDGDAVIERRADRDLVALNQFRDFREPGSPEHGEAEQNEEQVVEQETGFARNQRFELVLALQVRLVLEKEKYEYGQRDDEEPGEPVSDGRLREGVHRADDAA